MYQEFDIRRCYVRSNYSVHSRILSVESIFPYQVFVHKLLAMVTVWSLQVFVLSIYFTLASVGSWQLFAPDNCRSLASACLWHKSVPGQGLSIASVFP
jgi:hypothetical protein